MSNTKIGIRLRALREDRGLSQEDVTAMLALPHRQTLTAIEAGDRKISADELVKAVEVFGIPLDYFTNPFLLAGEARFSWRRTNASPEQLSAFELQAGEWIGAYRELSVHSGIELSTFQPRVGLTVDSTYEEAAEAGERAAKELELGDVPSRRLAEVIEERLSTLVLMVDADNGISGAACLVQDLSAVLINRHEPEGRRSFDLAHELFHILTWDAMPPDHLDGTGQTRRQKRTEQLADNFASALLMPRTVLSRFSDPDGDLPTWLNTTATELGVSATALKWRMVTVGRLDRSVAAEINDGDLRHNGRSEGTGEVPPAFSKRFISVIATAISKGQLSVRRAARLLGTSIDEFGDLCEVHGIDRPFDL